MDEERVTEGVIWNCWQKSASVWKWDKTGHERFLCTLLQAFHFFTCEVRGTELVPPFSAEAWTAAVETAVMGSFRTAFNVTDFIIKNYKLSAIFAII